MTEWIRAMKRWLFGSNPTAKEAAIEATTKLRKAVKEVHDETDALYYELNDLEARSRESGRHDPLSILAHDMRHRRFRAMAAAASRRRDAEKCKK